MPTPVISWEQEVLRLLGQVAVGGAGTTEQNQQELLKALGYSSTTQLNTAIASLNTLLTEVKARLGDPAVDTALPSQRSLLKSLLDKQNTPITPELEVVTTSGTIAAGAKFVSFAIKAGSGTILGTPVDIDIELIEFPYNASGYTAIPYTIATGGQFIIVSGR